MLSIRKNIIENKLKSVLKEVYTGDGLYAEIREITKIFDSEGELTRYYIMFGREGSGDLDFEEYTELEVYPNCEKYLPGMFFYYITEMM